MKINIDIPDNAMLEFEGTRTYLGVSLNIKPAVRSFMSQNNVRKCATHWTYSLRKELTHVNMFTIRKVHDELLTRAMINHRKAEIELLKYQNKQLKLKLQ